MELASKYQPQLVGDGYHEDGYHEDGYHEPENMLRVLHKKAKTMHKSPLPDLPLPRRRFNCCRPTEG